MRTAPRPVRLRLRAEAGGPRRPGPTPARLPRDVDVLAADAIGAYAVPAGTTGSRCSTRRG